MFHIPDRSDVANFDEFARSAYYLIEHDEVNLDEVIRADDDRQATTGGDHVDFCMPLQDWMLD